MVVAEITFLAIGVIVNAMTGYVTSAGVYTLFESCLAALQDDLGSMSLLAIHVEELNFWLESNNP